MSDNHKSAWLSTSSTSSAPWGHEVRWHAMAGIGGKVLHINAGCRTSFKYNKHKNEVLYFQSGRAKITYADEQHFHDPIIAPLLTSDVGPGQLLNVQSCCPYRIEAIEDCIIVEIGDSSSTACVRLEDDYGRAEKDI